MAKKQNKKEEKKTTELKKIDVLSLAKVGGLFGVIYGLIAGILMSVAIYLSKGVSQQLTQQFGLISEAGYSVLIILPIIYGLSYFIVAAITALIYNLISKKIGGIKLTLK